MPSNSLRSFLQGFYIATKLWSCSEAVHGNVIFALGNQTYLANTQHPKAVLNGDSAAADTSAGLESLVPFTVILNEQELVTGNLLRNTITRYIESDDVFSEDFMEGIYLANSWRFRASLDFSALEYLKTLAPRHVLLDMSFKRINQNSKFAVIYVASPLGTNLTAAPYAALISPKFTSFGTNNHVEAFQSRFRDPMTPVPSRIYSWSDPRPSAGYRVAIEDLFDMKGLITSGGSQAWTEVNKVVTHNTPSIQRIVDLGGVLMGKYKLAQIASGANPWDWQNEHYPFNPWGDGWLTCLASSSGGGCSIAAYDWLNFAIGSDTGSSMRRPAAVSGTYGNQPSINGLAPLSVPDSHAFPKRIVYLVDYLPLANPTTKEILQGFLSSRTQRKKYPSTTPCNDATSVLNSVTQYDAVARPLIDARTARYGGRFPPMDSARRASWQKYNGSYYTAERYADALVTKRRGTDWFDAVVLGSLSESCSENILLWDIGTGGLPSYREEVLIENSGGQTAYLAVTSPGAGVAYRSNITFVREMMPVIVSVIARRGCDFMLWNMWGRIAEAGALGTVKKGRTAF
ncbi:amidase family protein [Xylariaceae sp. FL1651]|nr:amidase family protein [Xylariaceae sp. FL1651]